MFIHRYISSLLLLLAPLCVGALTPYSTQLRSSNLATLRIQYAPEATGNEVGQAVASPQRPFLILSDDMLNDGQVLEISFDELSHDTHQYSYTLLHLNADWTPDNLPANEYIRGFNHADITDYEHSFNTTVLYTHYRFTFPNEDMQPLLSGNYALIVYEDGRQEDIRAVACFSIVQPLASINANIRSNTDIELNGRFQQLDIDVNLQAARITSPNEIQLVVEQNGRIDNRVFAPAPTFLQTDLLQWKNCRQLIFEAGNEYRHFDINSVYFMGYNVEHIRFNHEQHAYVATLFPSNIRSTQPYTSELDANGQFVINAERTDNDDTEADYFWVQFYLPVEQPWIDGSIYLLGDTWGNLFSYTNQLIYSTQLHAYTLTSLIKQGGHEWLFAFLPKGSKKASLQPIEGSFWQTRNSYRIYIYYRPFAARYDQLIGIAER